MSDIDKNKMDFCPLAIIQRVRQGLLLKLMGARTCSFCLPPCTRRLALCLALEMLQNQYELWNASLFKKTNIKFLLCARHYTRNFHVCHVNFTPQNNIMWDILIVLLIEMKTKA